MNSSTMQSIPRKAETAHDICAKHTPPQSDSSEPEDMSFLHRTQQRSSRCNDDAYDDNALPPMEKGILFGHSKAEKRDRRRRRRRQSKGTLPTTQAHNDALFYRLQEENARLPPQDSTSFILAQIERQNTLLEKDPKSICIQSNELRAHFSTVQRLVTDNLTPTLATSVHSNDADNEEELNDSDGADDASNEKEVEESINWDLWEAIVQDFDRVALKMPHLLSVTLRAGIPIRLRGLIWQAMCKSASLHLETVYGQLCCERSPHERVIQRDLARTFPSIDMFKQENGVGQTAMRRILEAYSLYDTEVGYCQGLAFLVGPLLMNMPETQAFCVFVRLMETYGMRTMFTLSMEGLQLRLYQFSCLLSEELPAIAHHMERHSVHAAMYASQWFLTLFAYAFPIGLVTHIYDIIFAEGAAETIMRIAIAMLKRSQSRLLAMGEFEDLLDFVTSRKLCEPYVDDFSDVIRDAMALSGVITRQRLDYLTGRYDEEGDQDKERATQVLANRFGFFWRQRPSKRKKTMSQRPICTTQSTPCSADTRSSISFPLSFSASQQPGRPTNDSSHVSIAFERLQREHRRTVDELFELKMNKQDVESERDALKITIAELERRHSSPKAVFRSTRSSPCKCRLSSTFDDLAVKEDVESSHSSHSSQGDLFSSDVTVVSTLTSSNTLQVYQAEDAEEDHDDNGNESDLHTELVKIKVANFELQQQCEQLEQDLDDVQGRYDMVHEGQMVLVDKLMVMKADMDVVMNQKKQRDLEWLELGQENARLRAALAQKDIGSADPKTHRRRCSTGESHFHPSQQSAHDRICELEQLLSEAKIKLAQEETAQQKQKQQKQKRGDRANTLPSPPDYDAKQTKGSNMKRSTSLYGRVWSAISPRSGTSVQRTGVA